MRCRAIKNPIRTGLFSDFASRFFLHAVRHMPYGIHGNDDSALSIRVHPIPFGVRYIGHAGKRRIRQAPNRVLSGNPSMGHDRSCYMTGILELLFRQVQCDGGE